MAAAHLEKGEIAQSLRCLRKARRLAHDAGMLPLIYFGLPYLTLAYLTVGAFERADQYADKLYDERDSLIQVYRRLSLAVSADVKIRMGQLELAQRIIADAFEDLGSDGSLFDMTRLLLADAHLHLVQDKPEQSLQQMEYLIGRMRQTGVRQYMPEGLCLQGMALLALDQPEAARAALLEAAQVAHGSSARRNLWQILWELSRLETAAGNASSARLYRTQAQEEAAFLADHAGDEELRTSFLSLPEVQAMFAG